MLTIGKQTQEILDRLEDDPEQVCGTQQVKESLGLQGIHVPWQGIILLYVWKSGTNITCSLGQ